MRYECAGAIVRPDVGVGETVVVRVGTGETVYQRIVEPARAEVVAAMVEVREAMVRAMLTALEIAPRQDAPEANRGAWEAYRREYRRLTGEWPMAAVVPAASCYDLIEAGLRVLRERMGRGGARRPD